MFLDLKRAIDAKLGRCPFCMRASLYGSGTSWLVAAAVALTGRERKGLKYGTDQSAVSALSSVPPPP